MASISPLYGALLQSLTANLTYKPFQSSGQQKSSILLPDPQILSTRSQMSALDRFRSVVSAFQYAMQGLGILQGGSPAQSGNTDISVATVTASDGASAGAYNIKVKQLPFAQSVQSALLANPGSTVMGSGTIQIQRGSYDTGSNMFTPAFQPPLTLNVNNGTLNSIASDINSARAGFTASVNQTASGSYLVISANDTGAANGFQITVTDADGSNTDMGGLSQLAYDPAAQTGNGKNMTLAQAPQDALFTLNGENRSSAVSSNITIAPGVRVDLLKPGSTTITALPAAWSLQSAAQGFVSAYNTLVEGVSDIKVPAGQLSKGTLSSQFLAGLGRIAEQDLSTGGGLTALGIKKDAKGKLSLDSTLLQATANSNPADAATTLTLTVQKLDSFAKSYIAPDGIISGLSQGLSWQTSLLRGEQEKRFPVYYIQQALQEYTTLLAPSSLSKGTGFSKTG